MNRILSFILIASFLSLGFSDFFHSQFHSNEIRTTKTSESSKSDSLPLEDHCNFQKCLSFISKINGVKNTFDLSLHDLSLESKITFLKANASRHCAVNLNISARGPPSFLV